SPFGPTRQGFVGNLTTQFTQPGALGRWLDLDVSLNGERGLEPTYDYWAERLRLGLPLRLGRVWTVVPSYNLELYQLGGSSLLTVSGGEVVTSNLLFLQGCPNTG